MRTHHESFLRRDVNKMTFNARIEMTITKVYGKTVELEAETKAQAQDIAEEIAMATQEFEAEWELVEDCDVTWSVTEIVLAA